VRRSGGPGWALVGDAGYFKDPITAHGMTDALRDSELLADVLLEALSGAADEAEALARYQRQRDRLSLRLFEATGRVASFDWDLVQVQQLVREASAAMTDEVETLQALGERGHGPGSAPFVPPDSLVSPR
jgi:flavin-dependent dehydrogenase